MLPSRVKAFFIFTLFWLLRFLWHRFPISLIRRALKPMTGESEESPVEEKFCSELKTFFLALPTACTCSKSSVEKIPHNYSVKWWLLSFWLFHIVHLPTVAARSSGWSCRNRNCRLPEVISQSTFKSVITVSASCWSQRELEQLDEWREKWNGTEINRLSSPPYLIIRCTSIRREFQHGSTTVLEAVSQEASHTGGNSTLVRATHLYLGQDQLQQGNSTIEKFFNFRFRVWWWCCWWK